MVVASPRAHPCLSLATSLARSIVSCYSYRLMYSFAFYGYMVSWYRVICSLRCQKAVQNKFELLFVGVAGQDVTVRGSDDSMTASTCTPCQPFAVPRSKISASEESCRVVGLLRISFSALVPTRGQLLRVRRRLPTQHSSNRPSRRACQ